jgi:hypothetical protein
LVGKEFGGLRHRWEIEEVKEPQAIKDSLDFQGTMEFRDRRESNASKAYLDFRGPRDHREFKESRDSSELKGS